MELRKLNLLNVGLIGWWEWLMAFIFFLLPALAHWKQLPSWLIFFSCPDADDMIKRIVNSGELCPCFYWWKTWDPVKLSYLNGNLKGFCLVCYYSQVVCWLEAWAYFEQWNYLKVRQPQLGILHTGPWDWKNCLGQ